MSQSFDNESSPYYDSPLPEYSPYGTAPIRYMEAYEFVFRDQNWIINIALLAVCLFIPWVGHIVILGYMCEIFDSLQARRQGYPQFDFNRFTTYLGRGIWPFLASLIVQMVLVCLMIPVMFLGWIVVAVLAGILGQISEVLAAIGMVAMSGVWIALILGIHMIAAPAMLQAAIRQDLNDLFRFDFVRDFLRTSWKELLLCGLFLAISSLLLLIAGALAFCIGAYVAIALSHFAAAHLCHQLYSLHLARGGIPVPPKVPSPPTF